MYTKQDAFRRIVQAKVGSLAPQHITPEYLEKLRLELYGWLRQVEDSEACVAVRDGTVTA